jgi:hypothetical protein
MCIVYMCIECIYAYMNICIVHMSTMCPCGIVHVIMDTWGTIMVACCAAVQNSELSAHVDVFGGGDPVLALRQPRHGRPAPVLDQAAAVAAKVTPHVLLLDALLVQRYEERV